MTYLPRHDTQYEPRTVASPYDCNMAAAADALRFWSLGIRDHNHDQLRHASGTYAEVTNSVRGDEGTNIQEAAKALSVYGCPSTYYTAIDGKTWANVRAALQNGKVVIAHGDYGTVPRAERGEIDPSFTGYHSVFFARYRADRGVQVGDGLSDQYEWWPESVASAYMRDFPGGGYTYLTVAPRYVAGKKDAANIYPGATNDRTRIGRLGVNEKAHYGGLVVGENVLGSRYWYRIFADGQIGYVHITQVRTL